MGEAPLFFKDSQILGIEAAPELFSLSPLGNIRRVSITTQTRTGEVVISPGIVKRLIESGYPTPSKEYVDKWARLKRARIPVISDLVAISDTEVLMPDLTADGSGLYSKHTEDALRLGLMTTRTLPYFYRLELDKVVERASFIGADASLLGIKLPFDDPITLRINRSGSWDFIVLDYSLIKFDNPESEALESNGVTLHLFVASLKLLKFHQLSLPDFKR